MSLSLVSGKSTFLHDGYIVAIENCCVPIIPYGHSVIAVRCLIQHDICHTLNIIVIRRSCSYRALYLSTIATMHGHMPKTCYCGQKIKQKNLQICIDHIPFAYIFVKGNVHKKEHGCCTFSSVITIIREVR